MSPLFVTACCSSKKKNPSGPTSSLLILAFCVFEPFPTMTVWFWDPSFTTEENWGTHLQLLKRGTNTPWCSRRKNNALNCWTEKPSCLMSCVNPLCVVLKFRSSCCCCCVIWPCLVLFIFSSPVGLWLLFLQSFLFYMPASLGLWSALGFSLPVCHSLHGNPSTNVVSGNHCELVVLFYMESPNASFVLEHPWLVQHSPHVDWSCSQIMSWNQSCHSCCLGAASPPMSLSPVLQAEAADFTGVPEEYLDLRLVFSKSRATSNHPRPFNCAIDLLPGTSLPRVRLFSPSGPEQKSMDKCIQEFIKARFIRHLSSPAGAGFFFVKKKDGSLHPCIDYRGLNDITVKNKYPLPLMSSTFELLQGAKVFTKSELCNAYHLVRIHEGDEWKTDVNTPTGHYEYLVLTFGLTNAPAVFQGMVNSVLGDMINQFVFVYLDDVLIFSPSLQVHTQHVRQVLKRLLQNQLYVKVEKSELHTKSVSFLGFIFSAGEIKPDPAKVEAVTKWPVPDTRKALQRFLGFANFCQRFIRNFGQVAAPLPAFTSIKVYNSPGVLRLRRALII